MLFTGVKQILSYCLFKTDSQQLSVEIGVSSCKDEGLELYRIYTLKSYQIFLLIIFGYSEFSTLFAAQWRHKFRF